jgi:hypothetical protein
MMLSFSAARQTAPDKDHRRAGRRRQQDQAGDVAVQLVGGQHGRKQVADEQPGQKRHRERLHQPVHEQRHADAAHVLSHLVQRAEVDLHQHRDDHDPDQQAHRQIDLRDFHAADGLEYAGQELSERDARHDAQEHPDGQVPLENAHGRYGGLVHEVVTVLVKGRDFVKIRANA